MKEAAPRIRAIQMLTLATFFWGVSFPAMKMFGIIFQESLPNVSSWFGTSLSVLVRFGGSALLMLFICRDFLKMTRLEWMQGAGLGLSGGLGILFQMDGISYTDASTSAFLTQAYCLIIPFATAILERQWPRLRVLFSTLLLVAGVAILARIDFTHLRLGRGELETLMAAFIFTFQIMWLERPVFRRNNMNQVSLIMFATTAVIAGVALLWTTESAAHFSRLFGAPKVPGLLVVLVLLCTLLPYVMMNYWQPFVSANEAAVIYGVEPVFASLLALVLPGLLSRWTGLSYENERITTHLLAGGGLIVLANIAMHLRLGSEAKGASK